MCKVHTCLVGRAANLLKQAGVGAEITLVQSFELLNNRLGHYQVTMTFASRKLPDTYTLSLKSKVKKEAILNAFINQCRVIAQPMLYDKVKHDVMLEELSDRINRVDGYSGVRTYVDYRNVQNLLVQCQVKKEFEALLANRASQLKKEEWVWAL